MTSQRAFSMIVIIVVLAVAVAIAMFASRMFFSWKPQDFIPTSTNDLKPATNLESQKQYLREQGVDCTHENVNSTYKSLAIDPQNPHILYVGIEGRGVYKSVDGGKSWQKKIRGLVAYPDSNNRKYLCFPNLSYIYIDSINSERLLLVTADLTTGYPDWPYGETGGIWESSDGGENWRQVLRGEVNSSSSGPLGVDPKNSKVMYYPVNPDPPTFLEAPIKKSLMKKGSVYKTFDWGKTWEELTMPMLPGLQVLAVFIDPQDSNHVVFFTQSHGHVYNEMGAAVEEVLLDKQHAALETFDGGKSWNSLESRLPAPYRAVFDGDVSLNNFNHWVVRPFLFGKKYPGDRAVQKSFYTTDGGKTFQQTPMYIWMGRYNPHDKDGNHLLGYAVENRKIVESKDAGKTWKEISTPPEVSGSLVHVSHFVWDPKNANRVYMSGDRGNVWRSEDVGEAWNNILNLDKLPD